MLRYRPATWSRLLARLGLCLAAFALLCALTGLSPTRRLALLYTLDRTGGVSVIPSDTIPPT